MNALSPEERAEMLRLRELKDRRLRRARETTKAWKLRNPDRVNHPAKERESRLTELEHRNALIEEARRTGDLSVYDPSMDQPL